MKALNPQCVLNKYLHCNNVSCCIYLKHILMFCVYDKYYSFREWFFELHRQSDKACLYQIEELAWLTEWFKIEAEKQYPSAN